MDVAYRTAGPDDADRLVELFRRTFTDTFGHLYRAEDLASFLDGHSPDQWREQLRDPRFAVRLAEGNGVAAGYAKLGPVSLPYRSRGQAIELKQLYLLQPWHGQGIAQALMQWVMAESRARGANELILSVFIDNRRARRFYEGYGFEHVGNYAFMVGSHADEDLIMRLALESHDG
jgi:diamine N-acetyltransferase